MDSEQSTQHNTKKQQKEWGQLLVTFCYWLLAETPVQ